ncbi:MAG TPA: DUF5666 domain-containing protein [Candidatus Sulfotelmatobacter sp.]|nr:DUF5666 domain-containing protein [Candidatus Sulfotelmatobacter sp.]
MNAKNALMVVLLGCVTSVAGEGLVAAGGPELQAQGSSSQGNSGQTAIAKHIGTVKAINGNAITLAAESGPEVAVTVQPNARLLRLGPGDKDLKNATPMQLQELQVGDTIRVRGAASDDGKAMAALEVLLITRSAVAAVSDQIRQDWQKRGIGGIVASVVPGSGIVTISIPGLGEKKSVTVHTSSRTVIRRYAPDSANFEAAKISTLQEIHVNDQLRARGDRSADGNDFTAVEIVTGTFPYVEGVIKSVDASANTISVQDVLSKKTVQLRVTADSQLRQVPADMAQRMAFMLKRAKSQGGSAGPPLSASSAPAGNAPSNQTPANQSAAPSGGMLPGGAGGGGTRGGGASGFQRMLDQTPPVTLAGLHKGDALAILATEGTAANGGTIVKLYSGVEPILEAAPNAMMLAPWSLGGAPNGDSGNP